MVFPLRRGALWPQLPEPGARGWVVKAQVLAGGRGKRGGILAASTRDELQRHAALLKDGHLGDEPVRAVYVEQMLQIDRELYLAAFVNRDRGRITVMASAAGGIDIEQVPESQVASIDIDPLIGVAGFQIERLKRALELEPHIGQQFEDIARKVVQTLIGEDAELVEVNPLIQTADGKLVAADAKVVLDDDARLATPRTPPSPVAWSSDSRFMQRCRELGVIGVDNRSRAPGSVRPAVSLLGNGAGSPWRRTTKSRSEGPTWPVRSSFMVRWRAASRTRPR